MLKLYQLVVDAWAETSARAAEGFDMQAALGEFTERVQATMQETQDAFTGATSDVRSMWAQYVKQLQGMGVPMPSALDVSELMFGPVDHDATQAPAYALLDSMREFYDQSFGRLMDSPGLGLSREFNEKVMKGFKSFQEYQEATAKYQTVTAGMWTEAVEKLMRTIGTRAAEGDPIGSLRELTKVWTRTADGVFVEAFQSDEYIAAQNEMLSASLKLRKQQRVIAEEVQRILDQPTRSELDEVYELLYKLRKQNKQIKAEVGSEETDLAEGRVQALQGEVDRLSDQVRALKEALAEARDAIGTVRAEAAEAAAEAATTAVERATEVPADLVESGAEGAEDVAEATAEAATETVEEATAAAEEVAAEAAPVAEQTEEAAAETGPEATPDDLTAIKGIGAATQESLYAAGLTTYVQLAEASADDVREALGADISADRLAGWQNAARARAES
jgi:class III poly(R)-hydroxyalkanoic acid synthase PhaE subunit